VGTRERRPLLGDEERRRPKHETIQAPAPATGQTTTTLRLRRRWPFSSSNAAAPPTTTAATAATHVTASTATATNSTTATTDVKTRTQRINKSSKSASKKSQRATLSRSWSANNIVDKHRGDALPERSAAALAIFQSSSSSQRKTRYDDGQDYFLPDPPEVSYSVSSTTTSTTSSFANLRSTNTHSTSAASSSAALSSFNNNNNTVDFNSQEASSSSSSSSSNSNNNTQDEEFATNSSWDDDAASHDSTCKMQHQQQPETNSKMAAPQVHRHHHHHRYGGGGGGFHHQHEEKKMEDNPFVLSSAEEQQANSSHATTASTLTTNDFQQQQQKQQRLSLGSGTTGTSALTTSTVQSSPDPSSSAYTSSLSRSGGAAKTSPFGQSGQDILSSPAVAGAPGGILSALQQQQKRSSASQQPQKQPNNKTNNPVRAILSRPLGRHTLPVAIARQWVVEVSSPEWDADEQRWKYRILVQSRRQQQRQQQQQQQQQQQNLTNSSLLDEQQQQLHLQTKSSSCDSINEDYNSSQQSCYPPPVVKQARSFTAAFTWRSLADFLWLERALRMEFHGALLLPVLSIALGKPADENLEGMPVESEKLRDWLSDALNGIRGQGEWILPPNIYRDNKNNSSSSSNSSPPSLLHAESMEAFLYRNCGPLQEEHIPSVPVPLLPLSKNPLTPTSHVAPANTTDVHSSLRAADGTVGGNGNGVYSPPKQQLYRSRAAAGAAASTQEQQQQQSLVQQFFHRPLDFLPLGELCAGPVPDLRSSSLQQRQQEQDHSSLTTPLSHRFTMQSHHSIIGGRTPPLGMFNCSSRALSSAPSLEVMDSFAADSSVAASPKYSSHLAIHSEVVEAERDLVLNYRATALSVMEKMQGLQDAEENIGLAWKRLAISLSNLFAYEKDVEHAKLGDLKRTRKENMPYRKVAKKTVDECLRVMARQKVERSVPALRALQAMLSAYAADLSAVEPSVEVYTETVRHLSLLMDDAGNDNQTERSHPGDDSGLVTRPVTSWDRAKEAMRALVEKERAAKNQLVDAAIGEEDVATRAQRKAYQQSILHHERALCNALTTMCRATPMRVARMSWCYWNTEATQCAALHSAANALRANISVASKDSVSRMLKRHLKEEKEDHVAELALIQRMVNLGNNHKFAQPSHQQATDATSTVDGDSQVEITNDELGEQQVKSMLRDQALLLARQRVGRWDSKLGLAIMRAVGIDDPNVRVEETTRDLRLIRKYAIGLRECLSRCIDAVDRIRAVVVNGGAADEDDEDDDDDSTRQEPKKHIRDARKFYLVEMARLFSGQFIDRDGHSAPKSSMPSVAVLTRAGVDMSDPFGWSAVFNPDRQGTRQRLTQGRVGDLALAYTEARDHQTEWLLTSLSELLRDYYNRVETVEGYVYMECVGIQLEKHFSEKRSKALSAFEKKTDITTAINIASRKGMPQIVKELQAKLDLLGPDVSHTLVKETKEVHFESKSIKAEIHALAVRRLTRARETSTERAIALMSIWAKEEESMAATELKSLGEAMSALERLVAQEDMGTGHFS
jgi:hypothetical protein